MCYAFRATTSTEDQDRDDIIAMAKNTTATNARRQTPPSAASSTPSPSASDDCVEVAAPTRTFSPASKARSVTQRPSVVRSVESKEIEEIEDDEDDEDEVMEESTTNASVSRKRAGSSLVKGSAKKTKSAVSFEKQKPSGKGEAYDDLVYRANTMARGLKEEIKQQKSDLSVLEDERDEALVQVSSLRKKLKAEQELRETQDAKQAADIKTSVKEMKVQLRAEWDKKNKVASDTKDRKHKEEIARFKLKTNEAQAAMKVAKADAKESKPEHSKALQAKDKKIEGLMEKEITLSGVSDKLKDDKAKLQADKERLAKALEDLSDEILKLEYDVAKLKREVKKEQGVSASHIDNIIGMKKSFSEEKKVLNEKWQIQYNNSQDNARRASDIQRSISTTTRALNESILKRDELDTKLKKANADISMLRKNGPKEDKSGQLKEKQSGASKVIL